MKLAIEADSWAGQQTQPLEEGAAFDDEHVKILLKSAIIVSRLADPNSFPPSLTSFVLQVLKLDSKMSAESRDLLVRLILLVGLNHSSVSKI
jgi:hypothetical protein